jgi:hypothetical protein
MEIFHISLCYIARTYLQRTNKPKQSKIAATKTKHKEKHHLEILKGVCDKLEPKMVKNNYLWGNSFVKDFFFIHCKSITILNV